MTSYRFNKESRRLAVFSVFLFTLLITLFSQTSQAIVTVDDGNWETINSIEVQQGRRVYDRRLREYYTFNTPSNNTGATVEGPLRLLVTSHSHPITNEDGNDNGLSYFMLNEQSLEAVRINFQRIRASFAYTVVVQQFVLNALDSDGDGIPDSEDACPLDADNDVDSDGICGNIDECPLDADNDIDNDGICGNVDVCPLDAGNDADNDGICEAEDLCPNDANNACISIIGQVFSDGATLKDAAIKVGLNSVFTTTDIAGSFTAQAGPAEFANDGLNDFFPIEVTAPGYATSHAKVTFTPGQFNYEISIEVKPISDTIAVEDDLIQGVEIIKGGNPVGKLTIPNAALPNGVSAVTGTVTYLDPTTDDILSAPGGDLLALPAGSNPNTDSPVPLESFGMMEFDLKDQNGDAVHLLDAPAEVCMQATPGLALGDTIPLWYYDVEAGLWMEEGQGEVKNVVNSDGNSQLMICGNVTHFTWWNYDQPIDSHSCFKYQFVFESNNASLSGLDWKAEGVSYNGISPERDCNRDSNDPGTGSTIDSVTVKRTTVSADPEQIRMFAMIGGAKFYLLSDGDGTYSLTQDQSVATVFDSPEANGSCLNNVNVDQCQFLDYLDSNADGILPLSTDINLPPLISEFSVNLTNVTVGADVAVSAVVTDPEGSAVNLAWTTECGYYYSTTDSGFISPSSDSGASGVVFNANYTAPSTLSYPVESCKITLTATDATGAFSTADKWITVAGSFQYIFEGVLYGTDGLPLVDTYIEYYDFGNCSGGTGGQSVITDMYGYYSLEVDLAACVEGEGGFIDLGYLSVNYSYQGTQWTRDEYLSDLFYGEGELGFGGQCTVDMDASTRCQRDIYLPTVWGPLSGNIYQPDTGDYTYLSIDSYNNNGSTYDYMTSSVNLASGEMSYGPISSPLGQGFMYLYSANFSNWNSNYYMPSTDGVTQDVGVATAPVIITVFDGLGGVVPNVEVTLTSYSGANNGVQTVLSGFTDSNGQFIETEVPIGSIYVRSSSPFYYYNGNMTVKDQPVSIDFNSVDVCTIEGTAFDQFGLPLSVGENISLYNGGNFLEGVTNDSGEFSVTGANAGNIYFNDNFYSGYNYYIDNCRTTDGSPRIIRMDRPFYNVDFFGGLE